MGQVCGNLVGDSGSPFLLGKASEGSGESGACCDFLLAGSETNGEILLQEQQLWGCSCNSKASDKVLVGWVSCVTRPHGGILGLEQAQGAT